MSRRHLVVVGGGSAGLVAAREATRRGARVTLVSGGPLGGDCTHTGCVPSKTLLDRAARGATFEDAMGAVRDRIDTIAATEDEATLVREGITVVRGWARMVDGGVVVDGRHIRADATILATGARPEIPPVPGLSAVPYLTNETVFSLDRRPDTLAVLGGGAIGVELALAFQRLGTQVDLVESEARILANEEPAASDVVARALRSVGVEVLTGRQAESVSTDAGAVRIDLDDGTSRRADRLLVATGRRPNTEDLGLDELGIETDDRGAIATDDTLMTTASGVWAVGDVTGRMDFTHAAGNMAFVAVTNALGSRFRPRPSRFDPAPIPWVTFADPEVARVGMTEAEAAEHGGRVAELPLGDVDRGVITGRTDGFVKLIAGPRPLIGHLGGGRIIGATIVAPRAGELIAPVALAMRSGMFAGRLAQATQAYPTWAMAIQETAAQLVMTYRGRSARPARPDGS